MDYKRVYNQIIENRKLTPLSKDEYGERHHIIPRSLGGTNEAENLVRLTAREHFICHALLAEMYESETCEWYKMNYAFLMMNCNSNNQNRYCNARLYELKREDIAKTRSFMQSGEKNSFYKKKHTLEAREAIRNAFRCKNKDNMTYYERKVKERNDKLVNYTTVDGKYINKYRRNKIKEVFNIDLEEDFQSKVIELKLMLNKLYNIDKLSTVQIGNMFETNDETIRNYLKFFGINRRTLSEAVKNVSN